MGRCIESFAVTNNDLVLKVLVKVNDEYNNIYSTIKYTHLCINKVVKAKLLVK